MLHIKNVPCDLWPKALAYYKDYVYTHPQVSEEFAMSQATQYVREMQVGETKAFLKNLGLGLYEFKGH